MSYRLHPPSTTATKLAQALAERQGYYRLESDLDVAAPLAEHDASATAEAAYLRADGFDVTLGVRNAYQITVSGVRLNCKPDIIAVRDDIVLVIDVMTGSSAHTVVPHLRVQLYMATLPIARPELARHRIHGIVKYRDDEVCLLSSSIDSAFRARVAETLDMLTGLI